SGTTVTAGTPFALTVKVPTGVTPGTVTVTVSDVGGTSAGASYTYLGLPSITTIAPDAAPIAGRTTIRITGSGFDAFTTTVTFDGVPAAWSYVTTTTTLWVTAPAHAAGTVTVVVTTPAGTSAGFPFTYSPGPTITSITPDAGSVVGGTTVTVTGTGVTVGTTAVTFGQWSATSVTVNSATSLTVLIPSQTTAGVVTVTVSTPGGTSNAFSFTYDAPPTITGLTPKYGPQSGGNTITITGTDFTATTTVAFGTQPGTTVAVNSPTTLTVKVPAATAPGDVTVTVTTPGGKAFPLPTTPYAYFGQPTIASITPPAGSLAGGSTVAIGGTDFAPTATVTFGGIPGTTVVVGTTFALTVKVPAGVTPGTVTVVVTALGGASAGSVYTYLGVPTITSITPDSAPVTGRTTISIVGTGFKVTTGTTVTFGGTPATSVFVATTATRPVLFVTAPPEAAGTVMVTVTTPGGTSAGFPFTYDAPPTATGLTPAQGPLAGGNSITVTGSHFVAGTTTVDFGTNPGTTVDVTSPTTLTVVVPAGTGPGTVPV